MTRNTHLRERRGIFSRIFRRVSGSASYRTFVVLICLFGVFLMLFSSMAMISRGRTNIIHVESLGEDHTLKRGAQRLMENMAMIYATGATPKLKLEIGDEYDRQSNALGLKPVHSKFIKFQYPVTINRPYLIENPSLCSSVSNLTVLVIVHTAPRNFDRRQNARRTWANDTYYRDLGRLKILFLLGTVNDPGTQKKINEEFAEHRDLLQGDFVDAYHNLTHKGVMAYKWITQRCRNAKTIVKVDDDVMVDTYKLFTSSEYLPFFKNKTKQILCNHILPDTMPILREGSNRWYVPETDFKGERFYPRYCSGFFVMISNDVIPAIYRAATVTPFFWVDDVYLYGLAPIRVPGIHYSGIRPGTHMLLGPEAIQCYKNLTKECDYLVTGAHNAANVDTIWEIMTNIYRHGYRLRSTVGATTLPSTKPPTAKPTTTKTPTTIPPPTQTPTTIPPPTKLATTKPSPAWQPTTKLPPTKP